MYEPALREGSQPRSTVTCEPQNECFTPSEKGA